MTEPEPDARPAAPTAPTAPASPAAPAAPAAPAGKKLSLDDRALGYDELLAAKSQLSADELILKLRDGRAIVRANAALGLAAIGHPGGELLPFIRDADRRVALAASEALAHLGRTQRGHLAAIAAALDGARPEVVENVQRMFSDLVGTADDELVSVLDTGREVVANAVTGACARIGVRGLQLLQRAATDERARVRINAVRGIAQMGELEQQSSMDVLNAVERDDKVSDVRAAARTALGKLSSRVRAMVTAKRKTTEPAPNAVPELEQRVLTAAELKSAATLAPLDELLRALAIPRAHARINAVRVLAIRGAAEPATVRTLAVLLRDPEDTVRLEVALALGKLGAAAIAAGPALVRALGDEDPAVAAAAEAALAELGDAAIPELSDGLDVADEGHGGRVASLIGRLPDGPRLLREALSSSSPDVRVHAALGLGKLGKARAAGGLPALAGAAATGNARVRAAVAKAIALLEPRPERTPPRIALEGFEQRPLTDAELAAGKSTLAATGPAGLAAHLNDGRAAVRANAAAALGSLGADALPAAEALAVCLRDDAVDVRLAAARALDRIGDAAVVAVAPDLVRALRDADRALTGQLGAMLRTRANPAIDEALSAALDTPDAGYGQRVCEVLCARPTAVDVLCEAWHRPTAQAHAARGLVMLGKERVGKGRAALEGARTDPSARTREIARTALRELDGPPAAPELPAVAGFDTQLLDNAAFANVKLESGRLLPFLLDGRPVVRANAATAVGSIGPAAAALATTVGALLRDDDDRVRIAAAGALDKLGDDAVVAAADYLVSGLRGNARVAERCRTVLAARTAKVETALLAGLETSDEAQGMRIAELICALPNARELLFVAFDGPAQNVQINAAYGIGMLGPVRAGPAGRRRLVGGLAGPFTRRREAMVKALALLGPDQPRS